MKKIKLFLFSIVLVFFLAACTNMSTNPEFLTIDLPSNVEYFLNETFDDTGLKVYSHQKNGDTRVLSKDEYKLSNITLNKEGVHEVRVSFKSKEAVFNIFVKKDPNTLVFVYIADFPTTVFYDSEPEVNTLVLEGLSLNYLKANGDTLSANLENFNIELFDLNLTDGDYSIHIVKLTDKTNISLTTSFYIYIK